jgi:hypothetical protein
MHTQVYKEAVAVGVLTVCVGSLVSFLFMQLPRPQPHWNSYHYMELSLMVTGMLIHLGCEASGLNKWYCQHGAACAAS